MSVSASVGRKAERLLCEGRVTVLCAEGGMTAYVRGNHDQYHVQLTLSGWICPCPARGVCAHVVAAERVTGWTR